MVPMVMSTAKRIDRIDRGPCPPVFAIYPERSAKWLHYTNAGHEVGEPYYIAAHSTIAQLPQYTINLGGTPQANAIASEDVWPRVLAFLNESL
jgi:hypothetical protein